MALQRPPVVRHDETGLAAPGMRCTNCHSAESVPRATAASLDSMPGHEVSHLAPRSMGWTGQSLDEIRAQLEDVERSGGHTLEDLVENDARYGLVAWGWNPSEGGVLVPGT